MAAAATASERRAGSPLRTSLPSAVGVLLVLGATASLADTESDLRAGDALRIAMPTAVVAYELWRHDDEGLKQFAKSWALTVGTTEVLKRATHVQRPDGSDDMSFPSGHASNAFAAATYMHRRHGLAQAWPWYVAATYVGWTRVQGDRHRWIDIAGSAALAAASSWWLVTPATDHALIVTPMLSPGRVALDVHLRW